jgi:predicted ribosome-associated RNA-binding protein Tma20
MNLNEKIISCKTSGAKSVIYNGDDYPLFVDQNGKGDYFPSLYTAIAFEPLIKILFLNEGVEAYIFNGANLMWPGVKNYSTLGQFTKN